MQSSSTEMPRIWTALGIAIVSTSAGVMTGKQAHAQMLVEKFCYVYKK